MATLLNRTILLAMSQTTLKMVSQENMDEYMLAQPLRISDAASMMRRKITKNEKPYTAEAYRCVNKLVDEWYNSVLLGIADKSGAIPSGRVEGCLRYFLEGKQNLGYQKYKSHLPHYSDEQVLYWIDVVSKSSISELYEIGPFVLSQVWHIIYSSIVSHFAEKKWEAVYSHSENPAVWDKLANDNPHVMNHRPMPFGLDEDRVKDIKDKIDTILRNPVTVQM
jgi:hypothetical protein